MNTPLSRKETMKPLIQKTKNLFPNGQIKTALNIKDAIIVDIPRKIKLLQAYKIQFDTLGFIAKNGQIVESKRPISDLIHSQINNNNKTFFDDKRYHNTRVLILSYFNNPSKLRKDTIMYQHFLKAFDCVVNTGSTDKSERHVVMINRLFRKNKGEAMYKHLEALQGL